MYPPAMIRSFVIAVAALLSACASTPGALERPENASAFTVDQPYQLTLKRLVEAEQNCRKMQLAPIGQQINDVQHYPDLREARIVQGASGVGTQIYSVIHVREKGDGSEVTLYTKTARDFRLDRLRRWASGETACS